MFRSLSLALLLCLVNAKSFLENVKYITGGEKQLKYLAKNVCNDLAFMLESKISQAACLNNFMSSVKLTDSEPQPVSVRCRSERTLQVLVEPLDSWQLLVLVPETEDDRAFSYSLVEPKTNVSEISVSVPSRNHVLFTTVLSDNVKPGLWIGIKVPAWKVERRQYDVQITFTNYSRTYDGTVNGVVSWNHTGDSDLCFEIFNICSQSGIKTKQTWPENKQRVIIERLHLDDQCEVSVKGLYGTTKLKYQTPSHDAFHQDILPGTRHLPEGSLPEIPSELSLVAREDGDEWTVRVGWAKPRVTPDRYNVTLRADEITTIVMPANATEAIFAGVTGESVYNVSVLAIKGRYKAHNYARAAFPGRSPEEWVWAGASGAWGAAGVGLLAIALGYLRLRKRIFTKRKLKVQDTKPLDEVLEALETESCEDQWEIKSERLLLHEVIGEGAFGVVRRGTLAPMGKEVAVKMLKDFPSLDEVRAFRLEMELMKSVGAHPHVVSLLGCCSGKRPLIVAQYCTKGDLLSFLRRSWDVMVSKRNQYSNNNIDASYRNDLFKCKIQHHPSLVVNKMYDIESLNECELTTLDLLSFCRQIAMGMEFLANNKLVHRDLAARNVLVTGDRTLKIADFGLSRDVYEENQYKQKGNGKMPVKWMAPESLMRRIYTTQSDVWSFGVVVWEVATVGGAPYPEVPAARLPRLLRAGYRMPRPYNCSSALYELMLQCWSAAPRARPTFGELHARLDELLNCACAHHYLCLELDAPPAPRLHAYRRMLLRGKRAWKKETYERPRKAIQGNYNHYSSPPVTLVKAPA